MHAGVLVHGGYLFTHSTTIIRLNLPTGAVHAGARVHGRGGESDLVVHDDVDAAAGRVVAELRETQCLAHLRARSPAFVPACLQGRRQQVQSNKQKQTYKQHETSSIVSNKPDNRIDRCSKWQGPFEGASFRGGQSLNQSLNQSTNQSMVATQRALRVASAEPSIHPRVP